MIRGHWRITLRLGKRTSESHSPYSKAANMNNIVGQTFSTLSRVTGTVGCLLNTHVFSSPFLRDP